MLTPRQLEAVVERHPLLVLRALRYLTGLGIVAKDRRYLPLLLGAASAARRIDGPRPLHAGRRWTDADLRLIAPRYWECLVPILKREYKSKVLNN